MPVISNVILKMNQFHKIALWCGLTPLAIGTVVYISWFILRYEWLMLAGMFTLFSGFALFGAGIICISIYFYKAKANSLPGYKRKSIITTAILLVNLPVAAVMLVLAYHEISSSNITIANVSKYTIKNLYLTDGLRRYYIDNIPAQDSRSRSILFEIEGEILYNYSINGKYHTGIIIGYVTSGMGATVVMTITESGSAEVHEKI